MLGLTPVPGLPSLSVREYEESWLAGCVSRAVPLPLENLSAEINRTSLVPLSDVLCMKEIKSACSEVLT